MKLKSRLLTIASSAAILIITSLGVTTSAKGAVIYRNNFGNSNASTNISFNTASIGWQFLRAQNGGNVVDFSEGVDARSYVSYYEGRVTDLGNINAPTSASNSHGLGALINGSGATAIFKALAFTTHYTIDREAYQLDSIQWYANGSAGTTQQAAIQIDGNWYISDAITPPTGTLNTFVTTATLQTVDFSTAKWYSLTATAGTPFAIGSTAVALPTGDITGFGLFLDAGTTASAAARFDTFTINATAIPEPGTALLLTGAALGLSAFRSIRRRSLP